MVLWKVNLMKRTRSGVTIAINQDTYGKFVGILIGTQIQVEEAVGDILEAMKLYMLITLGL